MSSASRLVRCLLLGIVSEYRRAALGLMLPTITHWFSGYWDSKSMRTSRSSLEPADAPPTPLVEANLVPPRVGEPAPEPQSAILGATLPEVRLGAERAMGTASGKG